MKKKKPFLVTFEFEGEIDVVSFGFDKQDAEYNVDLDLYDFVIQDIIETTAWSKEITENLQEQIKAVDGWVFGLNKDEKIEDYIHGLKEQKEQEKIDATNLHFDFWNINSLNENLSTVS